MGKLIIKTLSELMQIAAENIALGKDSFTYISVWADLAEEYGKL